MNRLAVPALRVACALFLSFPIGHSAQAACPAPTAQSVAEEMKSVDAVVVGKAIRQDKSAADAGAGSQWADGTYYTVSVSETVYGSSEKEIRLFSENSSGRFPMALNEPYLLFVSTCAGVQYIDNKGNSGTLKSSRKTLNQVRNRGGFIQ